MKLVWEERQIKMQNIVVLPPSLTHTFLELLSILRKCMNSVVKNFSYLRLLEIGCVGILSLTLAFVWGF